MAATLDGSAPSLENTRAKLAWADHHLDFFQELWVRYFDDDPYEVTAERDADRWVVLRLHIRKSPPIELGLVFGDWLYSLRSALDNMIVPLIKLNGKQPGKRRSFPVFDSERSFQAVGRKRIDGVSGDHAARIEALQPYPGRDDPIIKALELVDDLGNLDKHRAIHPVLAGGVHRVEHWRHGPRHAPRGRRGHGDLHWLREAPR